MMKKKYMFFLLLFPAAALLVFSFFPDQEIDKKGKKPQEWFFLQRAYPEGRINHHAYIEAVKQSALLEERAMALSDTGSWKFEGPENIGGRITDIEMDPSDMNTIYLGTASGGIFKSEDKGESWTPVFDEALSLSIGDIALAPSNPDILYAGTGEANAGGGSLAYDGVGIYRSEDAGENWTYIGLPESRNIGRMVVDPKDPDIVYVAAMGSLFADSPDRGVFKTTNGGDSWEKVLFVSDSTGAIDLAIHPTHPDTIYAALWERIRRPNRRSYGGASCGIYRSYDGGDTWVELTNGLPSAAEEKGRIGIDISLSDPDILYAIYADKTGYFNGVYKTTDGGDSWQQTNDASLSDSFYSYGWWFGRIKVDPVDPNNAFVIGFNIYRTQTGGMSWSNQSGGNVHVDQHAVYIHPLDNNFVALGNDGGLYLSENGGNNWTWDETLPITQFYTCETDYQMPWRLYGGTQDNGTNRVANEFSDDWEPIYGNDGFYVKVDPVNNNYVYAEYQYGGLGRSTNGGESFVDATNGISQSDRFNWNCPIELDPSDPSTLYFGSNKLYRSTNRAASWTVISGDLTDGPGQGNLIYHTLTTITVSPLNPDIIYTGSDDGNVNVSLDGGNSWNNVSAGIPDRWITRVVADPVEENVAYVTVSGYRWDEFQPHVLKTEDYGQNWVDISNNLPEAPVNDLIVNPANNQVLFVAADVGVFYSYDGGTTWDVLGTNLPNVVVNDLVYHRPTNKLIAATFGRSMYSYDLEQDELTGSDLLLTYDNVSISPNPFSTATRISVGQHSGLKRICISDSKGRIVKHLSEDKPPIATGFFWDGTDDQGKGLSSGVYLLILENENKSFVKKIVFNKAY